MTDLETIKYILKNREIDFLEEEEIEHSMTSISINSEQGYGYSGFLSIMYFLKDGSLYKVGAWEV